MVAGVQRRELVMVSADTTGADPVFAAQYVTGSAEALRGRAVVIVISRDAPVVREVFRRLTVDVDIIARAAEYAYRPEVYAIPPLVTGWLSPWHCGLHGARVQRRLNRAGAGRWRTRAVEVRRRQPGARATRRRPQAAIVKQVRKAMRRMAREVV